MSEDADRPSLEEAVRAEIQRLRRERHAAERVVEYYDWQLAELYRMYPLGGRLGERLRRARERAVSAGGCSRGSWACTRRRSGEPSAPAG